MIMLMWSFAAFAIALHITPTRAEMESKEYFICYASYACFVQIVLL
jgi:hypothetical protein